MKRCTKCLLPETWPGITFGDQHICSHCIEHQGQAASAARQAWDRNRQALRAEMDRFIESCRGREQYDVMVLLSGGKDSTYLLWYLKEHYRLKPLAFTCDNGFLSPVAKTNIEQTLQKMRVDHAWGKPPVSVTARLFRALLYKASSRWLPANATVCHNCFGVTYAVALKTAVEMQIPLLAVGFSPAQKLFAPVYRAPVAEIRNFIERSQKDPDKLFGLRLTADEAAFFAIPDANLEEPPAIILPFLALDYDIQEIRRTVIENGFISEGCEHPLLSNCLVNLLMIEFDLLRFGYSSYEGEFSHLLREGKLDREEWRALYERVHSEVDRGVFMKEQIDSVLTRIGLEKRDPPNYMLVPPSPKT